MTQVIYVGVGADTINVCTTKLSRTPLLREAMEMCNDILTRILPWNGGRSIGRFTLAAHAKEKKEKAMDAGTEAQKHVPSLSFSSTTYPADIYMERGKKAMEKTQKISDQGEEEASTKSNSKNNMYPFVTPVRGTIKRRIFACFLCNLKLACRRTLQAFFPQKEDI